MKELLLLVDDVILDAVPDGIEVLDPPLATLKERKIAKASGWVGILLSTAEPISFDHHRENMRRLELHL